MALNLPAGNAETNRKNPQISMTGVPHYRRNLSFTSIGILSVYKNAVF